MGFVLGHAEGEDILGVGLRRARFGELSACFCNVKKAAEGGGAESPSLLAREIMEDGDVDGFGVEDYELGDLEEKLGRQAEKVGR